MLQRRQRLNQPPAPFVNEKCRADAAVHVAEPLQHFRPTIHPVSVGATQ